MATPHFRHQLYLHGPQLGLAGRRPTRAGGLLGVLLAALLLAAPGTAVGQQRLGGGQLEKNRKGRITGITVPK